MRSPVDYSYILATVLLTVYGQAIIKWQASKLGPLPDGLQEKFWFLAGLATNPWVLSGYAAAFLAAISWMAAMTKFDLSYAYPFTTSLSFILVLVLSALLFHEAITIPKLLGMMLIIFGMIVTSSGK